MADEVGTEEVVETPVATEVVEPNPGPEPVAGGTPAAPTGINPAWIGLRDAIGEDHFATYAQPLLQEMDSNAHNRITNLNAQLKGYEGFQTFIDNDFTPDDIQTALDLVQMIGDDPKSLYDRLGAHLGITVEEPEEGLEQFGSEQEETFQLPPALQQQLTQMQEFQTNWIAQQQQQAEQAEQERLQAQAEQQFEQEMSNFLRDNPTWTEQDKDQLNSLRAQLTRDLQDRGLNRIASIEEAAAALAKQYAAFQTRFGLPNGAPSTLPPTAGGAAQPAAPDVTKMSTSDFEALIAADIRAANAAKS